jgi:hypothetical protein
VAPLGIIDVFDETRQRGSDILESLILHQVDLLDARELKIPDMEKPGQFLWPPPQPNLALQMIAAIRTDPFIISEAAKGTYIKERDRRVLEDNRRQIAEAEQRQREFEERQRKELESAKERDGQAYRERGWPSG